MLLGIISDTHDDMEAVKRAVEFFNRKAVSHVLHAGDIVSPFTFDALGGLNAEFSGIFGNNDGDRLLLANKSGGRLQPQPLTIELGGRKIVVLHEPDLAEPLAESGRFDIVIYGHTHRPDMRKIGGTLLINPGKTARLHKGKSTLALLATENMEAEIVEIY